MKVFFKDDINPLTTYLCEFSDIENFIYFIKVRLRNYKITQTGDRDYTMTGFYPNDTVHSNWTIHFEHALSEDDNITLLGHIYNLKEPSKP